jgi:peptide/nickel transport system permease protein
MSELSAQRAPTWPAAAAPRHRPAPIALLLEIAHNRQGVVALATIVLLLVIGIGAPLVSPFDPLEMHMGDRFAPPSGAYWLGTDEFGRDLFSRLLHGARVSLVVGLVAVTIATAIGVPLGLLAGFHGGRIDAAVMRVIDVMLAVPGIILAMVIVAVLGPNAVNAMVAVAIIGIPGKARLTRANTLAEKEREYVEAARCIGATTPYLMFRTILPNIMGPIIVQVALAAAGAVLLESSLSFLGLGTQPPEPSWGTMLNTGRQYMFNSPWYGIFPGLLITLLVLSLNNLADVIGDILDPSARRRRRAA